MPIPQMRGTLVLRGSGCFLEVTQDGVPLSTPVVDSWTYDPGLQSDEVDGAGFEHPVADVYQGAQPSIQVTAAATPDLERAIEGMRAKVMGDPVYLGVRFGVSLVKKHTNGETTRRSLVDAKIHSYTESGGGSTTQANCSFTIVGFNKFKVS